MVSMFVSMTQLVLELLGCVFMSIIIKSYFDFKVKNLISWVKVIPFLGVKVSVEGQKNRSLQFRFEKI